MSQAINMQEIPEFDLSGGNLCLDFANTLDNRVSKPSEHLHSYRHLIAWGEQAKVLSTEQGELLLKRASQQEAETVFQRAIEVREAIYRIFAALAEGEMPEDADLALLNEVVASALAHSRIVRHEQHFHWDWQFEAGALDYVLWPVVRAAADLLTSDALPMLRMCAAEDCGWLFMDTSKNQTRRWCSMKSCGNRAKARRHIGRTKQQARTSVAPQP